LNTPLVSILVPAYNAAPWIAATLASALDQTHPRVEVIVIDDGSRDDTLAISRAVSARHSYRVRVETQPNAGAAAARNHALRLAVGDFIQFLDADDLIAPDKIARQLVVLAESPATTVAACPWGVFLDDPTAAAFTPEPVWADLDPVAWLVASWAGGGMMHPAAWLVPRATADAAGPWQESLSLDDDGEYFTRVLLRSSGVRFVSSARAFYRSHDGPRLSASRGRHAAVSSFTSCRLKDSALLAVEDSARTRHALACNYRRFCWDQLAAAPDLAQLAYRRWLELDPTLVPPAGTRIHRLLGPLCGWRGARRVELFLARLRRR
jgi:glycosyltransferase involved in cell wall biosynthesis